MKEEDHAGRAARAEKARGTPFEALYAPRPLEPAPRELTKAEIAYEHNRTMNRERARAKRAQKEFTARNNLHSLSKRTGVMRDNKQYANWTI